MSETVDITKIGQLIRLARTREGLTLEELADRIDGMSDGRLSEYETGAKMPTIDMIRKILVALRRHAEIRIVESV